MLADTAHEVGITDQLEYAQLPHIYPSVITNIRGKPLFYFIHLKVISIMSKKKGRFIWRNG